uniref:Uncharacterized protein n=1 Tax=Spumella elongata TaxID=89044 RepID=A0A7S3GV44_9STRA|mmetsp:Transcript_19740/g.34219  ORF Transcript_19740/g.34219 Transcript_19740/m.34219 type:complete len:212 (+) Transcript_19740:74-709(+)
MGNGVSGSRSDHEDDLMSSPFPTFKSYTLEDATSYDITKGRTLCSNIIQLNKEFSSSDPDELLNHYSPMIIVYDQFYEELKFSYPSSILLKKTMQFRLSFLSELIANILSMDCRGDDSSTDTNQADTSDEQRVALKQWVTKYESEEITHVEYGYIGEALVKTLSDTHCGDKDWWKIYMWRRIYSHFLRITANSSTHDVNMGLERCSSLDLA